MQPTSDDDARGEQFACHGSDKVRNGLTEEERGWVQAAADEVSRPQPAKALELDKQSQARLSKMGGSS